MRKASLLIVVFVSFLSCKKDKEIFAIGTVIGKQGCFADSYLIAIENPDPAKQNFLRPTVMACAACYNCSNAVFLRLLPTFTTIGTKLRFIYTGTEVSCLSSSEAPEHVTAKEISKL